MKKITLLLFCLLSTIAFGQIPDWYWAKSTNKYYTNEFSHTTVDPQGNIYVFGEFTESAITVEGSTFTNFGAAGKPDIYVIKYTSNGDLLWVKHFGGPEYDAINSITTDSLGNFYLTGKFGMSISFGTSSLNTGVLGSMYYGKFDGNGNPIWLKQKGNTEVAHFNRLKADANGNLYMVGYYNTATFSMETISVTNPNFNATSNYISALVIKLDANGNCQWIKSSQSSFGNVLGTVVNDIAIDPNNNVIICGKFSNSQVSFGSITLTKTSSYTFNSNLYILKYNSSGVEQWAYNTGSQFENITCANALACDVSGNIYIGGLFTNTIQFGGQPMFSMSGSQAFLVKYTNDGAYLWGKTPTMANYSTIQSLDIDNSGNLYAAGSTFASSIDFGNGVALNNLGTTGLYVTKYNSSGTALWSSGIPGLNANNNITVDCFNPGEIYVAGYFETPSLTLGNTTLTKTNTNYNLFLGKLYSASLSTDEFSSDTVTLYPNPVSDNLYLNLPQTEKYSYSLHTVSGVLIKNGSLDQINPKINTSTLEAAVYFLTLEDSKGSKTTKKFIKQ